VLFAVIFSDRPEQSNLRAQHLADHIDWLATHSGAILVAGSLRNELSDVAKGGLWIVEACSKADVLGLVQTDPFFLSGLRSSVDVLHWSKAFPEQRQLV
jgi:uncharacterized protein